MKNILLKATLALLIGASASGANAQTMYGITDSNQFFTIANIADPSTINGPYAISGVTGGQVLVGLDTRQSKGTLYALGYNAGAAQGQLYTITGSGTIYTANAIGAALSMTLGGTTQIGFGFISALGNQIRVTSANGRSYVINADSGTIVTSASASVYYATGDLHSGTGSVAATTYDNNYYGADATTEYGYDIANNTLVKFDNANYYNNTNNYPATLHSISLTAGLLLNDTTNVGAANWYDNTTHANTLFLTGTPWLSNGSHLYRIDVVAGVATDIGAIGSGSIHVNDVTFQTSRDTTMAGNIQGQLTAALTLNNRNLIFFDSYKPSYIRSIVSLKGVTSGQSMIAIAYGYNQKLYGLGYNSANQTYQLYTIDSATGNVTAVNTTAGNLNLGNMNSSAGNNSYTSIGFNFIGNATNTIRIIGNNGAINVQLNALTGQITETDNIMQYTTGDVNFGNSVDLSSIAYTYGGDANGVSQMIGYDVSTGAMVTLNGNIDGSTGNLSTTLNMAAILSFFANNTGYRNGYMDIYYDQATNSNLGYMVTNYYGDSALNNNYSTFYTMNNFSSTGTATPMGSIGEGTPVKAMAVKKQAGSTGVYTVHSTYTNTLLVYPNPAIDVTRIVLDAPATDKVYVNIINLNGRLMRTYEFASGTDQLDIDLGNIPTGLYNATIISKGAPVQSVKILKQ